MDELPLDRQFPVPKRFRDTTTAPVDWPDADGSTAYALSKLFHIARGESSGRGALLCGPPGRGKTRLVAAALNECPSAHGFITIGSYQRLLMRMLSLEKFPVQDSFDEHLDISRALRRMRNDAVLLGVDDLGKEHTTKSQFIENEIDFLLRYRFDRGLPTLVTTNLIPDDFQAAYGDSMFSFIHEAYDIIVFDESDVDWRMQ